MLFQERRRGRLNGLLLNAFSAAKLPDDEPTGRAIRPAPLGTADLVKRDERMSVPEER